MIRVTGQAATRGRIPAWRVVATRAERSVARTGGVGNCGACAATTSPTGNGSETAYPGKH